MVQPPLNRPGQETPDRLQQAAAALTAIARELEVERVLQATAQHLVPLCGAGASMALTWYDPADNGAFHTSVAPAEEGVLEFLTQPAQVKAHPVIQRLAEDAQTIQLLVNAPDLDADSRDLLAQTGCAALTLLPLMLHSECIGMAAMARSEARSFTPEQLELGALLAAQASNSLQTAYRFQDAQQRSKELEAVYQASLSLAAHLDLEEVWHAILKSTLGLLKYAQDAHIFLYEDNRLEFGAAQWSDGRMSGPWATPREDGLTYTVARQGRLIVVPDMRRHPLFENTPPDWTGAIVGLPLKIGERVVGVMTVAYTRPRTFPEAELRLLRLLGDQAAIAIENARLHKLVNQQAHTDALTGLPNRRALDKRLEEEIRRSSRYHHRFTLVMMDIDGFKEINDTYGHPVGDEVLKQVAARLSSALRDTDFVARYGGDEFAAILPETDASVAWPLLARMQKALAEGTSSRQPAIRLAPTVQIGIAVYPEQTTAAGLLNLADQALYEAKRQDSRQQPEAL